MSWGGSTRRRHAFASMVPGVHAERYAHVPEGEAAAPLSLTEALGVVTVPDALPVAAWSR